jgi:hypothetical protein
MPIRVGEFLLLIGYFCDVDIRSFRVADCDTDHCLVVAELKEGTSMIKRASQK